MYMEVVKLFIWSWSTSLGNADPKLQVAAKMKSYDFTDDSK